MLVVRQAHHERVIPALLGQHLLIDGRVGVMPTPRAACCLLEAIARLLDMRMLGPPQAYRQGAAVVGFVVIAESHVSLHLYPAPAWSYVDIFSCKRFNSAKAIAYVSQRLRMTDVTSQQIDRGVR